MITSDTNFRGNFDSIEAVWEAIPYGGVEGDYLNIQGVKYRWNKYLAMWENAEVVTETPARETVTFDEDVNMQNNLTVAGVLRAKKFVVDDLPTGIEDVEITESAVSGGNNVITFTYTNGESQTFNIKNGEAGKTQAAFAVVADALDKTGWDTAKCYLVLTETEGEFDVYSYENEAWNKIDTIEIDLNYDVVQTTGQSASDVMSQKAVTDSLDEIDRRFEREESVILIAPKVLSHVGYIYRTQLPLVIGKKYKIEVSVDNTDAGAIGIYLYNDPNVTGENVIQIGRIADNENSTEFIYKHIASADYRYIGFWNNRNVALSITCSISEYETIDIKDIDSEIFSVYDKVFFEKGALSQGAEVDADNAFRTPFIPIGENVTMYITSLVTLPTATYEFIVYYKDGVFVRSENYGINTVVSVSASNEYNQVRILLYRASEVTEEQAANIVVTINPAQSTSNIDNLDKRVKKLENNGDVATVEIYANDIAIDLSTEVLNLSNKTNTNQRFNGTSIVNDNSWRLLSDTIPAVAGEYYVVDNSGDTKLFQIAYVNSNGDILKVHGTDGGANGNYISNHFIRKLGSTGIRIAVKTTSLSGLHLVNGRKFKIVDEAKRNAFNNLCSDGRINVAYIKDASDVNRISMALKLAGSYGVVFIPSGRYELSSCIWAGLSGQSIEMESDTMLVASDGFTDNYLMEWKFAAVDASDPDFPNPQGESSALANAHITGGVFNAKGLCGCLYLSNFRGLKVSNCQFYNAATNGVLVERPGYELIMHGCAARNEIPGLANNVGFNLLCNDCHYYDLITVNYHTGFKVAQNAFLTRCHPWIGSTDFPTYYADSIGFDLSGSYGCQITDCYSDTFQTHYKLGQLTKLIGCTTLSSRKEAFPIDEYGNVNLIHNDYDNNVIIGCTFRTSGVTPVRNSGSKDVTEIGCTYTTTS